MRFRGWLFGVLVLVACEPGGGGIVDVGATGTIVGTAFVDANASGSFDAGDVPAAQLSLALVLAGSGDTLAGTRADAEGDFIFAGVPVGTYEIAVPASALGDTMLVVFRDPPGAPVGDIDEGEALVTVGAGDSVAVAVGVAYPVVNVETARSLPAGRRVFVAGIVVAGVGTAADSTLFLEGQSRGIAARRMLASPAIAGDSAIVFGVTATRDGQPVLTDAFARVVASELAFDTIRLFAAGAANAGGGIHDARLARVSELIVTDTTRTVGASARFIMTAEDPTGSVQISIPVALKLPEHAPGFELTVIGVLVPRSGVAGQWQIRPRGLGDILEPDR